MRAIRPLRHGPHAATTLTSGLAFATARRCRTVRAMSTVDLEAFIAGLPKCELHLHLEGTLSPELKLQLAARNGIALAAKTVAEVEATYEFDSLASFLAVYYPAMDVLVTADDFRDLAYAY